jgi:hypothetical protein
MVTVMVSILIMDRSRDGKFACKNLLDKDLL